MPNGGKDPEKIMRRKQHVLSQARKLDQKLSGQKTTIPSGIKVDLHLVFSQCCLGMSQRISKVFLFPRLVQALLSQQTTFSELHGCERGRV